MSRPTQSEQGTRDFSDRLVTRIVDSLTHVPVDVWDDLAWDAGFYMSHSWLRDIETHPWSDTRYILVEEANGRLAAALPVHLVHDEVNSRYDTRHLGGHYPEFVLGSRRGYRSSVLVRRDGNNMVADRALSVLGEEVRGLVGEQAARMWFIPDQYADDAQTMGAAIGRRTTVAELDIEAWVPVGPGGFDELVQRQPSSRRRKLHRERRVYLNQGYETRIEDLRDVASEAGALLGQLEAKYGSTRPVSQWVSYYERLSAAEAPGEVLACRGPGDTLLGFVHFYQFGDALWARTCGLDYPRLRDAFEYFNLAIFELVELGAARGLRRLHLGMESLDAKQRHGAVLERLSVVTFERATP